MQSDVPGRISPVLCVHRLRGQLLAGNVLCPGLAPLLLNLLSSCSGDLVFEGNAVDLDSSSHMYENICMDDKQQECGKKDQEDNGMDDTMQLYLKGLKWELYEIPLCFAKGGGMDGLTFHEAAWVLYQSSGVMLIAVVRHSNDHRNGDGGVNNDAGGNTRFFLSPEYKRVGGFRLRCDDVGFVIARSNEEALAAAEGADLAAWKYQRDVLGELQEHRSDRESIFASVSTGRSLPSSCVGVDSVDQDVGKVLSREQREQMFYCLDDFSSSPTSSRRTAGPINTNTCSAQQRYHKSSSVSREALLRIKPISGSHSTFAKMAGPDTGLQHGLKHGLGKRTISQRASAKWWNRRICALREHGKFSCLGGGLGHVVVGGGLPCLPDFVNCLRIGGSSMQVAIPVVIIHPTPLPKYLWRKLRGIHDDVQVIRGSPSDKQTLWRAGVDRARAVVFFAGFGGAGNNDDFDEHGDGEDEQEEKNQEEGEVEEEDTEGIMDGTTRAGSTNQDHHLMQATNALRVLREYKPNSNIDNNVHHAHENIGTRSLQPEVRAIYREISQFGADSVAGCFMVAEVQTSNSIPVLDEFYSSLYRYQACCDSSRGIVSAKRSCFRFLGNKLKSTHLPQHQGEVSRQRARCDKCNHKGVTRSQHARRDSISAFGASLTNSAASFKATSLLDALADYPDDTRNFQVNRNHGSRGFALSASYQCGAVTLSSQIETLLGSTFHTPWTLQLLHAILSQNKFHVNRCGAEGSTGREAKIGGDSKDAQMPTNPPAAAQIRSSVRMMMVPPELIGKRYEQLVETFLRVYQVVSLGLYRARPIPFTGVDRIAKSKTSSFQGWRGWRVYGQERRGKEKGEGGQFDTRACSYEEQQSAYEFAVATHPPRDTIVRAADRVFVLGEF